MECVFYTHFVTSDHLAKHYPIHLHLNITYYLLSFCALWYGNLELVIDCCV